MKYELNEALSRELAASLNISTLAKRRGKKTPQMGNCYLDAFNVLAVLGPKAYYAEGQAINMIPVEHAFVIFEHKIVDVTWVTDEPMENHYVPSFVCSMRRLLNLADLNRKTPFWQTFYGMHNDKTDRKAPGRQHLGEFLKFHNHRNIFKVAKLAGGRED